MKIIKKIKKAARFVLYDIIVPIAIALLILKIFYGK